MAVRWLNLATIAAACLMGSIGRASEDHVDYQTQIKPLLRERCFACHGALKQESGMRLDTVALMKQGGDSGAVIAPGAPAESILLQRVSATEVYERMPPDGEGEPLTAEQIAMLRAWIRAGAPAPVDEPPQADPKKHWAFQPVERPAVPETASAAWGENPIDAFIARQHQRPRLTPQPEADKRLWLRRVSLDLVGLPPTREQLHAFVADCSPHAHERVVTRLLNSPQHGQRWGRHWMDLWRYSDWWGLGAEVRHSQKHIWHWRDWIIESVNADKGYDQMLREMLAADELSPHDFDRLRATGYLARQYFIFNRTSWLDETIEHTAKAMLGLTFNCAKCHDHKYDPFSQEEYYRLRAVFEPYQVRTEMVPGQPDFGKDGIPRAFDANLDEPTYLHIRGDDRHPDKTCVMEPAVPAFLSADDLALDIEPVSLPVEAVHPGLRPFVVDAHREASERLIAEARTAWEAANDQRAASEAALQAPPADSAVIMPVAEARLACTVAEKALATAKAQRASVEARAAADHACYRSPEGVDVKSLCAAAARSERLLAVARSEEQLCRAELAVLRATADSKADAEKRMEAADTALKKARDDLQTPGETYTPLPGALKTKEHYQDPNAVKPFPATSSGRRTAFANWLTDPRHPLPARVAVNHIWARHMGQPLVPTVFDFGLNGKPPTHPELLDWLAAELVEHDWSMKHIHLLITTSQTYRLTSSSAGADADTLAADPDNRYYWRMNPVRMEAQIIRDSLLHLAGELDVSLGGPSIPVREDSRRRSLYFVHSHNDHQQFLSMFDDANVLECYRRAESIIPQQALALENSELVATMAGKIAERIVAANPTMSDAEFIRKAFVTVLACDPTEAEQTFVAEMLPQLTAAARAQERCDPAWHARVAVVQALLNHNDFVTIR